MTEQLKTHPSKPVTVQPIPSPIIEKPSSWMREGDSPAEIILAVAVLMTAIAGLLQVWLNSKR